MRLWVNRFEEEGSLESRFKNSGRKRITTEDIDNAIFEYADLRKFVTATGIANIIGVNRRTVGRRLKEKGLFCRKPARKTELSREDCDKRLEFIEENYNIDWEKVVFSDEKSFKSYTDRAKVLYRPKGFRYHKDYVQQKKLSGRITCGVWGYITAFGFGELCEISSKMKSEEYISILDEVYKPSMQAMFEDERANFVLMQDNAPTHTSIQTKRYFDTHPDITILQNWPSKSPDMNPIENVWGNMTRDWHVNAPISREAILNEAKQRWDDMIGDTEYITHLYQSIPRRFDQIIQNDGHACKY